ncbi:MAG: hypothetical protein methR_P2371 [Methyloprofundus sp.]|nr:MAG: hypothetical protein methR_P2371 [Methyloprofundus sp.]
MQQLTERQTQCPYCGEMIDLLIDDSEPEQNYIEDCQVCCQPIIVDVSINVEGKLIVVLCSENE